MAVLASVFSVLAVFPITAYADLDTAINRKILEATRHDTSRSNYDKLFKNRCAAIEKYAGFDNTVDGQARKYSCQHPGIGIALYAGKDLGKHSPEKITNHFQSTLAKDGLSSQTFIQKDHPHGSSMAFYINGESWLREPVGPMEGIKDMKALIAEAKLILFTDGRVKEWIYKPTN